MTIRKGLRRRRTLAGVYNGAGGRDRGSKIEILEKRELLSNGSGALATYVAALYHDLLDRTADPSGQAYWAGRLEQGENLRAAAASIVSSQEYRVDKIDAAYARILGRLPDREGLEFWLGRANDRLGISLLAADEFYSRAGGNDRSFLQAAYQQLLGRSAEPAAEQFWLAQLAAGRSREDVALSLADSPEGQERRVDDDYERLFQRPGDASGVAFWQKQFAGGATNDEVLTDLVSTNEYFKDRTGQPITATPVKATFSWWSAFDDTINARAQQGHVDLLFVGDSITAGWNLDGFGKDAWANNFAGPNAMVAGIPGDTTQTLLWRLAHDDLDQVTPKLTVLMIGTNNVWENDSPADIDSGVRAVVAALRSRFPETKILVMGIPPIGETADNPLRRAVAATNALLSSVGDGKTVYYLDFGPSLLGADGKFLPGVMQSDFTHPSEGGYAIWAAAIKPMVDEIAG